MHPQRSRCHRCRMWVPPAALSAVDMCTSEALVAHDILRDRGPGSPVCPPQRCPCRRLWYEPIRLFLIPGLPLFLARMQAWGTRSLKRKRASSCVNRTCSVRMLRPRVRLGRLHDSIATLTVENRGHTVGSCQGCWRTGCLLLLVMDQPSVREGQATSLQSTMAEERFTALTHMRGHIVQIRNRNRD